MGNHQFGFVHRPPEFFGKRWPYNTEKRRKSSTMRRPHSAVNISDFSNVEHDRTGETDLESLRGRRGSSAPSETPSKSSRTKRRGPGRGTVRCSPTVPDSLTLSVDLDPTGLGLVGLRPGANADAEAFASALSSIQKLTPAAPRFFEEPAFDMFFEEAERRHTTMEALQAALNAPSTSTFREEHRCDENGQQCVNPAEKKRSAGKSLSSTSGVGEERAPAERANSNEDPSGRPSTSSEIESEGAAGGAAGPLSPNSKGKLIVIVTGGGTCSTKIDGEFSENGERWDNFPPTIIVQPAPQRLFSSTSSSSSMTTTTPSPSPARPNEPRRVIGSNPTNTCAPFTVRFADQTFSFDSDHSTYTTPSEQIASDAIRRKTRSHYRRKTIGALTNLPETNDATMSEPESVPDRDPPVVANVRPRPLLARLSQQQAQLRKKSLSKSDLLCPPPIITLLKQPQIILIRQLWQQIYNTKGPTVLGNHIFQRVFFKNPLIKDLFRKVDLGNQHVSVDCMCKAHSKAVAVVLDDVVKNLDNLRIVEGNLMQIGQKHAAFNDQGFHINFWQIFAEAFIDCTLEWGEKNRRVEESRKAWAIIIAYITDKMKFGFQEARRNMTRPGRRTRQSDSGEGAANAGSSIP